MEQRERDTGLTGYLKSKLDEIGEWMKPDPTDALLLRIVKTILKCLVLLLLIALSPLLLAVLVFVFFAAF